MFDQRSTVQTPDVAIIDFTNDDGSCGSGTTTQNTMITGRVPAGEYTGIVFVNGVPESVNHQNIVDAKAPLNDPTMNWGWTTGYRFISSSIAVEPTDDAEADGGAAIGAGNSFAHVGAGGCSGSTMAGFTCARPNRNHVKLTGFDPTKNVIVADLAKVFEGVDLTKPVECHGPSTLACESSYKALGLNPADGTARTDQQVFRVE